MTREPALSTSAVHLAGALEPSRGACGLDLAAYGAASTDDRAAVTCAGCLKATAVKAKIRACYWCGMQRLTYDERDTLRAALAAALERGWRPTGTQGAQLKSAAAKLIRPPTAAWVQAGCPTTPVDDILRDALTKPNS